MRKGGNGFEQDREWQESASYNETGRVLKNIINTARKAHVWSVAMTIAMATVMATGAEKAGRGDGGRPEKTSCLCRSDTEPDGTEKG